MNLVGGRLGETEDVNQVGGRWREDLNQVGDFLDRAYGIPQREFGSDGALFDHLQE